MLVLTPALLMFLLDRGIISFGNIIHRTVLPCAQRETASVPCYAEYDTYSMALLGMLFLVALVYVVLGLIKCAPYEVKR